MNCFSPRKSKYRNRCFFVNADASFDFNEFRGKYFEYGIIFNTVVNSRNEINDNIVILGEMLYEQRYTVERINVRMDSSNIFLNRCIMALSVCKLYGYVYIFAAFFTKNYKNKKSK